MPQALSFGLSLNDFWGLNPKEFEYIVEGYKLKMLEKQELIWLAGSYNSLAIASCFSKSTKYPKQPSEIAKEERYYNEDGTMTDEGIMARMQEICSRMKGREV